VAQNFDTYWPWWWLAALIAVIVLVGYRLLRPRVDVEWKTLDHDLQWDSTAVESLNKVYEYVIAFSDSTIAWYQRGRRPKRSLGFALRLGALLVTAAAGVVPLTDQLFGFSINPVWSTVLVAAAGIFVSIDIFGGYTSGWVRYMLAQQKVERMRDAFLLEWNALKATKTDVPGMLERAKTFMLGVGKVIDDETQEWATEFQKALKEMERARKEAEALERTGAIEVSVKNHSTVKDWILEIDGSERGRTTGKCLVVTDVMVGIRKVKVHGQDPQGKAFCDEKTIKVEGGTTVAKELVLS
jgi:SMODS and SLOG-associating 2TM effector domain 2